MEDEERLLGSGEVEAMQEEVEVQEDDEEELAGCVVGVSSRSSIGLLVRLFVSSRQNQVGMVAGLGLSFIIFGTAMLFLDSTLAVLFGNVLVMVGSMVSVKALLTWCNTAMQRRTREEDEIAFMENNVLVE
mmetsp:Transcript_8953/g.36951  ORF Transcript_8953/g.36951 Transcript_8953/m.36951 type:complete len:131 (-) Transcript_8953:153-545(-)